MRDDLRRLLDERIGRTRFVDVHEHLVEESTRLRRAGDHVEVPCADAALLFWDYAADDLTVAGMPPDTRARFFGPETDPGDKWRLVAPYWARCRNTGALQAVRETFGALFAEPVLDAASFTRVSAAMAAWRPGFYREVLDVAGVESCQVNSLEAIFCESEQPDLLHQDICISWLSHRPDLADLARWTGIAARDLPAMHEVITWFFDRFGDRAVAVKSLGAYTRRLDYTPAPAEAAAPVFARYARGEPLDPADDKLLQDHLMHYCVLRATEHGLPVKIHCGYQAGHDRMPLEHVRRNAADLYPLITAHPDTVFVLMHMGYPYQDEYVALAKHFSNVYVDLSFTWMLNPLATVRFAAEYLVGAPAAKLFAFGGDHRIVEAVVGHARLARRGLAQALARTVEGGWLTTDEALDLVGPLMRDNARAVFSMDG